MPDRLRAIQRHMAFTGWKGEPDAGFSHKEDVNGNVIAKHHDETWLADFDEANAFCERREIVEELERRTHIGGKHNG